VRKEKQHYFNTRNQIKVFNKNKNTRKSAMKNIFTFLATAILSSMIFASCTKCSTCSYSYKYLGKDSVKSYPEQCGNKQELKNYREMVNVEASTDNGATVSCTEK